MKKKNEIERKCLLCGRIITNPNNKTRLCPKCQKAADTVVGLAGIGVGVGVLKLGSKILKIFRNKLLKKLKLPNM